MFAITGLQYKEMVKGVKEEKAFGFFLFNFYFITKVP